MKWHLGDSRCEPIAYLYQKVEWLFISAHLWACQVLDEEGEIQTQKKLALPKVTAWRLNLISHTQIRSIEDGNA